MAVDVTVEHHVADDQNRDNEQRNAIYLVAYDGRTWRSNTEATSTHPAGAAPPEKSCR
jgi:hypothetical protein